MPRIKKILLVCTGNSCRSVMAAGLLKKMLEDKGDYEIMTAGTAAFKGAHPTNEAIEVMSEQKIDVSKDLSSPLSDEMLREADLILVMEERHKEYILHRAFGVRDKLHLLSEFGRIKKEDKLVDPNIPDPIGKSLEFYRKVFDIIKESILRTVKELESVDP